MTATTPVPATLPNVVRRGTPVLWTDPETGHPLYGTVVYLSCFDESAPVTVCIGGVRLVRVQRESLTIDMTDATGRAHVAWALGGVGASWHLDCEGYRRWCLHGGEEPRRGASQAWEGIGAEQRAMRGDSVDLDATDVPTLDSLDPDDDTRLPDGSRWVDAEALARVALHVLGLPPLVEVPDAE